MTMVAVTTIVALAAACTHAGAPPPGTSATPPSASATSPTPQQDATAKALAAYNGYRQAYVTASATADYNSADLAGFAVDPALAQLRFDIYQLFQNGQVTTGRPSWSATVVAVHLTANPATADLTDCFDITNWHTVFKATGKSAEAPGQATRLPVTAQAVLSPDGKWRIRESTVDRSKPC
jgi:hypothetical protein